MPELDIIQQTVKVRNHVSVKRETLHIDKLISPRVVRKVEASNLWEWRAKTDLGCARVPIFGLSKSLNDLPKRWYPVQDAEPLNIAMTNSELRDSALMAVRGECWQAGRHPQTLPPLDALIMLFRMIDAEPDLLFATWARQALHNEEIYFFVRAWEKDYQKNFMPKVLPSFVV